MMDRLFKFILGITWCQILAVFMAFGVLKANMAGDHICANVLGVAMIAILILDNTYKILDELKKIPKKEDEKVAP